jgi:radical SAM superfamily enzyme YgiQ (UPF0313 family)
VKIALVYPPPWKIPAPGEAPDTGGEGPPHEYAEGDLDSDFFQTPYGLFSLGAQALRAGHQVKVANLSAFTWTKVEEVIAALDADVYGFSCWTANRRGVALAARAVRRLRPRAHVVVGGPHATPLAGAMLRHHPEIDTVCIGESEQTFLELLERIAGGKATAGLPGTAWREGDRIEIGPERAAIENLDTLASPHDYFDTHIVMTSRGCPWRCTFCGAEASWGRGYRGQSVPYVLDALERTVSRLPVKMVQIKDDTFTTNRKRVVELCRGIRARGLRFLWSCDTRVDVLSDELLREMRLAGCERLSLGVESGSQRILDAIDKKITVDEIVHSTELAKKWGIKVRYYMMVGNRGETRESFEETLRFLERARPHQYIFACLSVYPGTRDFDLAKEQGWLDEDYYFETDFQELKTTFDASPEDTDYFRAWFLRNKGLHEPYAEGVTEALAIAERLGGHHAAEMDLGGALFREGRFDEAEARFTRALELGYPCPGLVMNYRASIALARGQLERSKELLAEAARQDPQHLTVVRNIQAMREWLAKGAADASSLRLEAQHAFQLLERPAQPTLPGPLPKDYAVWAPPQPGPERPIGGARPEDPRKLRVVSGGAR